MSDLLNSTSEELILSSKGYRILKILGEGSYAKVYLADYRTSTGPGKFQLACKIIDTRKAPRDFIKKFLPRELDILVKLNHPHIIHVHSVFQRKSKYYIFMRHAEQGDLLEYVSKRGPCSEPQARVWFRQLSLAIQYLHEIDIVHRDLKCENALITYNYNLKLADFGFARYTHDTLGKALLSDTYCGSLSYAAPEILRGQPYLLKGTDVWSLGVILYVMLNKSMPFDDNNAKRLYEQQTNRRWKFRSKVVNALTEAVKKLVTNMLEPDPSKRMKIDEALKSGWMAMDPRLMTLTTAEQTAKLKAQMEAKLPKTHVLKLDNEKKLSGSKKKSGDLKMIKEVSQTEYRASEDAGAHPNNLPRRDLDEQS